MVGRIEGEEKIGRQVFWFLQNFCIRSSLFYRLPPLIILPCNPLGLGVLHKYGHAARVRQGAGVSKLSLPSSDLPQYPPHDLPTPSHGKGGGLDNHVGGGERADRGTDGHLEGLAEIIVHFGSRSKGAVTGVALAFDVVAVTDHGGLGDEGVGNEGGFQLCRSDPVKGGVERRETGLAIRKGLSEAITKALYCLFT